MYSGRKLSIKSSRDVWFFTGIVAAISLTISQGFVWGLYFFAGSAAFHMQNAIIFACVVPIVISAPITYVIGRMSQNLSDAQAELQVQANTDALTQLSNRRSFFNVAQTVLEGHEHNLTPAALMVIDADHFKELNDSFGHAVGDKALKVIADILRDNFRHSDLTCRVGGEEFAVLLPGMTMTDAQSVAKRVVKSVNSAPLLEDGAIIEFSVSCGVADTSTSYDLQKLFKAADDAMYMAKSQGRNRVVIRSQAAA